jgi:hypothetical protein
MMDPGPDPTARIAALDQELASLDDRLNRSVRSMKFAFAGTVACVVAVIVIEVAARPAVYRWELITVMIAFLLAVAGDFVLSVMIRSYRAEIRELRSRVP